MEIIRGSIKQNSVALVSEFVVIVLGVLVALAVDEWRDELALEERRRHIIESLLVDLKEDQEDYEHFLTFTKIRAQAADFVTVLVEQSEDAATEWEGGPGEALFQLGITARLQTTRTAFAEMNATGSRSTIVDNELRAAILKYYALAADRAFINDMIEPEMNRYRQALESLGVSYSDRKNMDVSIVLADATALAIIRSMGDTATFAPFYCQELLTTNKSLIEMLEAKLGTNTT